MAEESFPDFPKLYSPLVRKEGKMLQPYQIEEGFEWAFQPGVTVYEKLDGTNVGVRFNAAGEIDRIQNRRNLIWDAHVEPSAPLNGWALRIFNAVRAMYNGQRRGPPGEVVYGEAVGPKLNTNRHNLRAGIFVPFRPNIALRYAPELHFETPEALVAFVRKAPGLFCSGYEPEGVVLYGPEPGQIAKMRRDMLPGYKGEAHKPAVASE